MSPTTITPDRLSPAAEGEFLVDVRTPAEFEELHIPSSINVPLGDLERALPELRKRCGEAQATIVCRTGQRAEAACKKLAEAGLADSRVLAGGIEAWRAQGLPLRQGKKAVSLERQVRIAAGAMVVVATTAGLLLHPAWHGLAAFVGAGLVFAGVTDTCGMAMVLARMPWNRGSARCADGPDSTSL